MASPGVCEWNHDSTVSGNFGAISDLFFYNVSKSFDWMVVGQIHNGLIALNNSIALEI